MRRVVLSLAVVALVALSTTTASAQLNSRIVGRSYYTIQSNNGYAEQGFQTQSWSIGQDSGYNFNDSVRRIQSKYSGYRYNPHPRSNYQSGPNPYDVFAW